MLPIRNPFIAGGPIPPERFFGRAREVNAIMNRLTDTQPASSAIYGEARIGKTSLLHYLKSKKNKQDWDISSEGFTFIYFDCGGIDNPVDINFWRTMLLELQIEAQNLQVIRKLVRFAVDKDNITLNLQEFFKDISAIDHRLIFLLDEFEYVINKSKSLLEKLRAFTNEQDISLVVATADPLPSLVRNIDFDVGQTFDRLFDTRELKNFNKEETETFIRRELEGSSVEFSKDDYLFIWETSQGHPFKVQYACSRIFEDKIFS